MTGKDDGLELTRDEEFERPHLRSCESWLCGCKGRVTVRLEADQVSASGSRTNGLE